MQVPVFGWQFELLVAVTVEINLVGIFLCLDVEDSGDKRIRMGVFVVELARFGVVKPRLR